VADGPPSPDPASPPAPAVTAAPVAFEHVSKRYDGHAGSPAAVNDLSITVPAGRICVLVGPSGCGKTTTLKMVNRLIEPSSGRVLVDGVDVATRHVTDLRRSIGYVIQQVGLFPHQTVAENVATVPRLLGWPGPRQRERAEHLIELVGLPPEYGRRYPGQLSGGERQRVGVARALAADPPVMLMDEPFGAVDPIVRSRLQDELLRLQRELAKTILFVTHDIDEAIRIGDLVAVMEQGGRLAQFATPAELLARPASDFVAQFVGADRGLKRLSLVRVRDLPPEPIVNGRPGEQAGRIEALPGSPPGPRFHPETTLRDALSRMLDAGTQTGLVVDGDGRAEGMVTIDAIGRFLRDSDAVAQAREAAGDGAGSSAARHAESNPVGDGS
jgi:osmoprotectant transport system ATP-binding protein